MLTLDFHFRGVLLGRWEVVRRAIVFWVLLKSGFSWFSKACFAGNDGAFEVHDACIAAEHATYNVF
jgi:hypothetical protein